MYIVNLGQYANNANIGYNVIFMIVHIYGILVSHRNLIDEVDR